VIYVIAGGHAPYTYDGRPYARIESSTGLMSQHLYEQLLVRRGQLNHEWDTQLAKGYTIDLLDHEDIRRTIKEGVDKHRIGIEVLNYDIDHILRSLELIKNDKPINAAVVLYAKDVRPDYSQCMIRLARFRGRDKLGDFIDNQRVYGNAFRIISAALEFAMRHLPIASFFEPGNIQRIDQPAVPQLALREALVNAISHRDYANHSATISLSIYDDRLELWNNGVLPPQLSFAALRKKHESYPRNKTIATIFYEQGWVEGWGTGTTRMIGYCQKNGTPEPEFEEYSGGFVVIFRFKEPMGGGRKISNVEKTALNKRQEKILEILAGGKSLSANEIFVQLDDVASLRTVKADLAALKKLLLLEQIGKGRATVWKVRR
jgi:ATP-dependent DNA helicase RecG